MMELWKGDKAVQAHETFFLKGEMNFKILPVGTQDMFLSEQTEKQLLCKLSNSIKKLENQNRHAPLKWEGAGRGGYGTAFWHLL